MGEELVRGRGQAYAAQNSLLPVGHRRRVRSPAAPDGRGGCGHTEAWDQDWTPPRSQATRREVEQRLSELGRGPVQADAPMYGEDDQVLLEDLTRAEVLQLRDRPATGPTW